MPPAEPLAASVVVWLAQVQPLVWVGIRSSSNTKETRNVHAR